MTEISWSIAQNGSSGNANSQLLLLEGSSPFVCTNVPLSSLLSASCFFIIYLLFRISLACFLVHPSATGGRRWNTLLLCIPGIYVIWSQMAAKMSNWECLHVINCSCCFCSWRWWEGSQQQPGADGWRGICLGGVWLKSTGMGCAQPHSVGQWDHRNGFILASS